MKKVAIVTGANKGLGFASCMELARQGRAVLMTSRSIDAGNLAAAKVRDAAKEGTLVSLAQLDLCNTESIDQFVEEIRSKYEQNIDLLINNGAIMRDGWNKEAFDQTFASNFYGTIDLTHKLLPSIADGGRIVMVTSGLATTVKETNPYGQIAKKGFRSVDEMRHVPFLKDAAESQRYFTYSASKALLNAATRFFASSSDLRDRHITIDAVCPGWCRTDLGSQAAPRSAEDGARSILDVALKDPPTNGLFYLNDIPRPL